MRGPLLLLLTALPCAAQYHTNLATTRDGSVLYFTYTPPTGLNTRIYRWTYETGTALFADGRDRAEHLYGTQLTEDGTVLYHAEPLCSTGMGPGFNNCSVGETRAVVPDSQPFSTPGFLLVSPNGHYGVFAPYNTGGLWVDWVTGEQVEVDFHGSIVPNVSPPFSVNQHAIANNGIFLITAPGLAGVRVWSKDGEILLPATDYIESAAISADGSTVAMAWHDSSNGPTSPTHVYHLQSGSEHTFAQSVSLSDDGQMVAYPSADLFSFTVAQAMVARFDGTSPRKTTNNPAGIRSVLLSGDAHYLYVVAGTRETRIQRYDLTTAAVDDIPAVP